MKNPKNEPGHEDLGIMGQSKTEEREKKKKKDSD